MIENIRVIGTIGTRSSLGRERGGGQIHGPEHQTGGGEIDGTAVDDAEDFRPIQGYVVQCHRHAEPWDGGEAAGPSAGVEAGAGVEVVATAGASADCGTEAVATVEECVSAETDDCVHGKALLAFSPSL
jgi:hypothetical protein